MAIDTDVLIIGAGMSGVGLAIQLVRNYGTRNFELVEKTSYIGGTWHVNSYPGCGCDVSFVRISPNAIKTDIAIGPISLLFLLVRLEPELVSEVCHAARDTKVL